VEKCEQRARAIPLGASRPRRIRCIVIHTILPAAMVCSALQGWRRHHELEDADQVDCTAGANVLMHTVLALAGVAS